MKIFKKRIGLLSPCGGHSGGRVAAIAAALTTVTFSVLSAIRSIARRPHGGTQNALGGGVPRRERWFRTWRTRPLATACSSFHSLNLGTTDADMSQCGRGKFFEKFSTKKNGKMKLLTQITAVQAEQVILTLVVKKKIANIFAIFYLQC
jgi:hypothetical protein